MGHSSRRRSSVLFLLVGLVASGARSAHARQAVPTQEPIANSDVFLPLLADPKQTRFTAAYLYDRTRLLGSPLVDVGLGQTFGLLRLRHLQLSLAAGAFSQFTLATRSADLVNTDFLLGLPLTFRHGAVSTRLRVYHQSSHL